MDQSRKEYIQKLKRELETVDSRFNKKFDQLSMVSEDYHSTASKNWEELKVVKVNYYMKVEEVNQLQVKAEDQAKLIQDQELLIRNLLMECEDHYGHYIYTYQEKDKLLELMAVMKEKLEGLESANKHLQIEVE